MPSITADYNIIEESERTPLHRFRNVTMTERRGKYFIPYPDNKSCYVS